MITPRNILEFAEETSAGYFLSKEPEEIFRSTYHHGQTIVLRGERERYKNSVEFWLACQAWYDRDESPLFDDISNYTEWMNDPHRVGVCKHLKTQKRNSVENRLKNLCPGIQPQDFILMDPTWDNEKILFEDDAAHYLYYFWTEE